jgi:hypothetical protein
MRNAIGCLAGAALLALGAVACGGGAGSASLDGVDSFGVGSALMLTVALPDGGASLYGASLMMVNSGLSCDDFQAAAHGDYSGGAATSFLSANLVGFNPGPGTYPLSQEPLADGGTYVILIADVFGQEDVRAAGGTFTLDKFDATGMAGSFDAQGGDNNPGELKGSFDAPTCAISQ